MQSLPTANATAGRPRGSGTLRLRSRDRGTRHGNALGRISGYAAALAVVLGVLCTSGPVLADDLADVQALVRQGNLSQATDRLNAYLAKNPKDARGRFLRGLILTEQKRPADAIRVFLALTEDFPELPEPYNNLAVLYAAQGQFDRARQMLESAIRTHPSYATAHENLGDIYAKMASEAYDRALQLDRSNTAVQTKLALIRELFSTNPKFQRPPLAGEAPKQVAIAGQAAAPTTAQPVKGAAAPAPAAQASSRPVVAREPAADAQAAQAKVAAAAAAAAATAAATAQAAAAPAAASTAPTAAAVAGSEEVLRTVEQWAQAWSGNDVNRYLSFYAKEFKVPGGDSRADWEKSRRDRIAKPKKIEVRVSSPQVKPLGPNRVSVAFRQDYRSPTLKSSTPKTLILVRAGDRWLIEQEQVGR
ncbi:MAG: tetratricopeptide repeat protein [bacterium]|jgi:Flp pilus assembly protein TadD|nr:tetratricopeptide repeat protein [Betaproteobacteria bacterium]